VEQKIKGEEMRLTARQLRRIIKEELTLLTEKTTTANFITGRLPTSIPWRELTDFMKGSQQATQIAEKIVGNLGLDTVVDPLLQQLADLFADYSSVDTGDQPIGELLNVKGYIAWLAEEGQLATLLRQL
jgi:hypothetical protein